MRKPTMSPAFPKLLMARTPVHFATMLSHNIFPAVGKRSPPELAPRKAARLGANDR